MSGAEHGFPHQPGGPLESLHAWAPFPPLLLRSISMLPVPALNATCSFHAFIPSPCLPRPPSLWQTCVEFEQRVTYLAHATPASLWEDVTAVYRPVTV